MTQPLAPYSTLYAVAQTTPELRAIYSAQATVQAMLDVEAALADAQAKIRLIPAAAARTIRRHCRAESFAIEDLANGARLASNLAIPVVSALTAKVAAASSASARYVHWGATSQDITDTAAVLQLRAALLAMDLDHKRLLAALRRLARRHRRTVMTGRTLMQAAAPTTFGLKAASWLDALLRQQDRLDEARHRCLVLQFGGAVGTLASLGSAGPAIARQMGRGLKLPVPDIPWHGARERFGEIATVLGLLVGALGKMARDISLLAQSEVGELAEPAAAGRGGSSTMPHKRNPVACAQVLAAAFRMPHLVATMLSTQVQENERALGGWHAEWTVLPEIVLLAGGALRHMTETIEGLEVDVRRMRQNLDARQGLPLAEAVAMALAEQVGKKAAHDMIEHASHEAVRRGIHLRQAIEADPRIARHFSKALLDRVFDPGRYLGASDAFIDAVLKRR